MPSHTTERRPTHLKTKNSQNCQKMELSESPTTKDLKKKYLSRLVGGVETGSWMERTHENVAAGGPGSPTFVYH